MKYIKISDLRKSLTKEDYDSKEFQALVKSIKEQGILTPIVVTEENLILDGRARYEAAKEIGLDEIPCYVTTSDFLFSPERRILTDPISYARDLKRLIDSHPELALEQIAEKIGKSAEWIKKKLELLNEVP